MRREVRPELLDGLPADDPAAIRSRDELRIINAIMGNHRWLAAQVREHRREGWRVLELGAGDGALSLQLVGEGACAAADLAAIDFAPRPAEWPTQAVWHQRDLLALDQWPEAEVIATNLFLHHFEAPPLAEFGRRIPASCRVLLICEPARHWLPLAQARLLSAVAELSPVTHHDMLISIRAGFHQHELANALGLAVWQCVVTQTLLGSYRMVATR